ncbi:sensor histidine kinase [Bacillus atrophaeus]|uniref:histidine kinase n=1 Tax=Bacillus atrophaeus (strain 1942) TaxID=720555 RepID=A0ABN3ZHQ5_BACA1|nr:sensor histidine kinase [Bacillus atrophaeus]AMR60945.1 histidine kinase [Bacillus subtilis subsp. globigii]ADP34398.1 two-component sensor histidine kinase (YxjL) [Bacillus atrophaeus 1942]AIK48210.1 histidine kinase family protein [Bacillus atrophaeus subsp. globigii]EIM11378.1 two-component sensor histidine kinase YxjL [Bacillus atrophaeus C89]KFK82834.1 histidine kinase family protein [Bacillus atrophaeus]
MNRKSPARHYKKLVPSLILILNGIQFLSHPSKADPILLAFVFTVYLAFVWIIPYVTSTAVNLGIFILLWLLTVFLWTVSGQEQGAAYFLILFLMIYAAFRLPSRLSLVFTACLIGGNILLLSSNGGNLNTIIGNISIMIGLYVFFSSMRFRREARKEAERNHAELANMHVQLEQAHEELQKAHTELQEASVLSLRYAVLEERTRIARDIHDSIGHELTSVIVQLQSLPYILISSKEDSEKVIQNVLTVARECLQEVRSVVHQMGRSESMVGLSALRGLIHQVEERSGLSISLDTAGLQEESWPQNISETIYRVLQEALTNTIRHASASRIAVVICNDDAHLHVKITDNGQFTGNLTFGFGLSGMKDRAEQAGGSLSVKAVQPSGLQIELSLPLTTTNKEQRDEQS